MEQNWVVDLERQDYFNRNHLLLVANGYIGLRGAFAEMFDKTTSSIHIIGIYDQLDWNDPNKDPWHPEKDKWKEIINIPDFASAPITWDGEQIRLTDDNVSDFRAWLDMRTAVQRMEYIWKSSKGSRVHVAWERFCAYHIKNLVYAQCTLTALDGDGKAVASCGIDGQAHDAWGLPDWRPHLENFSTGECDGGYFLNCFTQQHKYQISICSKIGISASAKRQIRKGQTEIRQECTLDLKKDKPVTLTFQHSIFTSRDSQDPLGEAQTAMYDYKKVRTEHEEALAKHWEVCNVEIEGDPKAQKYMRYNLYILLVSIPKDFDYASIPSRSLSAQTYKGAIFWEVDTYAFPFYAYVYPEYVKNILLYRYKCLMYAMKKAHDLGYDGAYFAWESLDTGEEATKKLVWRDIHSGRMMRNYFGDRQYHIAGDVIYAAWQYYNATGDWEFMLNYGAEMTFLVSRFIGSLVYYKVPKDRYEILQTVCPDEYHEEQNNNPFTNRILQFVLEKAFDLMKIMEEKSPEKLSRLKMMYRITDDEIEYWHDILHKMYIIPPNDKFVIEQFDGYLDLEDITMEEFKNRIIKDEYLGHQIGPAPLTQIVKQADVVQLLVMFKNEYHPVVRKATFDYYDPRTEHGSGDSPNAYGIVAAQVGNMERAYHYFMRSARIDLESTNPKRKANFWLGGVHIAPSGGTWQVIALGFAGLEFENGAIKFNPVMPKEWKSVKFNFQYLHQFLTVTIDPKTITVESKKDNSQDVEIKIGDTAARSLAPGETITAAYPKIGFHHYIY